VVERDRRRRDERGQVSVLIIGFSALLLMAMVVVIDATAAYLERQRLDTLADGAALRAADAGAEGRDVYARGVRDRPLDLTASAARAGVAAYLRDVGAYAEHPGLGYTVRVVGDEVRVSISADADLPLTVPGSPQSARVTATGSAVVTPE
jgi:uncharacterized membrane protein